MNKHPSRPLFLLLLTAVLAGTSLAAESEPPASPEVAAAMQPYLDSYKLAGYIAIIADKSGKVHFKNIRGYAGVEAKKPMSEDNVFWIASMTKMFAGASIMMLADEGKVSLEDPVTRFIPQLEKWMVVEERDQSHVLLKPLVRPVTVRHVLSHTSGLTGMSVRCFNSAIEIPDRLCYEEGESGEFMNVKRLNRREFLKGSLTATSALLLGASAALAQPNSTPAKRTAVDQVTLGQTGIKLSRLGMGTGSNSGQVQFELGRETFNGLVHYAYDQGITYFDCAQTYKTFDWMAGALKGLPREKLFIQSKIPGQPEDVLQVIDHHRKIFDTDYVDSMLIHCMVKDGWTDQWKRIMDGFDTAKEKGWIRGKGVSCHSLPALRTAAATPWAQVHLVRVNPQGRRIDGPEEVVWSDHDNGHDVSPVVTQLKTMRAKGRGVIGMKIIGNGEFVTPEDREKSIRFAMSRPELDAVVIGFKSRGEIDEAIQRMNRALAEA